MDSGCLDTYIIYGALRQKPPGADRVTHKAAEIPFQPAESSALPSPAVGWRASRPSPWAAMADRHRAARKARRSDPARAALAGPTARSGSQTTAARAATSLCGPYSRPMSATSRRTQLAPCAQDLFLDHTMQGAHRFLTLAHSRLTGKARFAPHRGRFRPRPCDQGSRPSSIADRAPPQADTSHSACNTRELPAIFFINRRIDLVIAD